MFIHLPNHTHHRPVGGCICTCRGLHMYMWGAAYVHRPVRGCICTCRGLHMYTGPWGAAYVHVKGCICTQACSCAVHCVSGKRWRSHACWTRRRCSGCWRNGRSRLLSTKSSGGRWRPGEPTTVPFATRLRSSSWRMRRRCRWEGEHGARNQLLFRAMSLLQLALLEEFPGGGGGGQQDGA